MVRPKAFILALIFLSYPCADGAQWNSLYPDKSLTPGAVDPSVTASMVCTPGYTSTVRDSSISTRKKIFERYGLNWKYRKFYEVDHFVSLSLGGNNSVYNLWPERYCPLPRKVRCMGAREKDVVEHHLLRLICKGELRISDAQALITKDWVAIYNSIKK